MFRIDLSTFRGPLDLLLFLIRKNELDVLNIPIATVTEQYLEYITVLEQIDINTVGDFIAMASTLIEIKSFEVLPGDEVCEVEMEDPKKELVKQLLVYKRICDSANELEQRARAWQKRYPRLANDLPSKQKNLAEEPIREVELWDLVSAFGRIIRENAPSSKQQIVYDDTPISMHMKRIYGRLKEERQVLFRNLFEPGKHRSTLIGIFLALLELVRHEYADVRQETLFGEIEISYRESSKMLDFSGIGDYGAGNAISETNREDQAASAK